MALASVWLSQGYEDWQMNYVFAHSLDVTDHDSEQVWYFSNTAESHAFVLRLTLNSLVHDYWEVISENAFIMLHILWVFSLLTFQQ